MTTLTNMQVRAALQEELLKLKANEITAERANAAANVVNAIVREVALEMKHQLQRGEKPRSSFFGTSNE